MSYIVSIGLLELWVPSNCISIFIPLNFSINNLGCFSYIKTSYFADKNTIATSYGNAFNIINLLLYIF